MHYYAEIQLWGEVTKQNVGWHTQEGPKRSPFTSIIDKEQRKQDEERQESMEKMMTQLQLLTNHVMGTPKKVVNEVASEAYEDDEEAMKLDEEIRYFTNYLVDYQPTYQRKG